MTIRRIVGLADETLTRSIIAAFFEVYNTLGYGFLESVYAEALTRELRRRGHRVEREVLVKVWFKGQLIARQRVDMLVDGRVIVETKAGLTLPITGSKQLYNYLRGTDKEVGLLLHFGPEPKFYREYCPNSRKSRSDASAVPVLIRDHLQGPEATGMPADEAGAPVDDAPVGDASRL
jgi:GxxExxY protein